MKQFIIYIESTGEIVRSGICKEQDFILQKQKGEEILEGYANSDIAYVKNKQLIFYTQDQIEKKKNKTFLSRRWSNEVFDWIDVRSEEQKYNDASNGVKATRNQLLAESDWTQIPDVPLTNKQDWAVYRQALRDIPEQSGYPFNINWPVKPE